jgi:hypothetical protein
MVRREREMGRPSDTSDDPAEGSIDAIRILENVVHLDEVLDEGSRRELGEVPYLELSKHLRIKRAVPD